MLEHPSASRLHAVLQFKGAAGGAFLYDAGSAHGTFLNKRRLKPRVHAPIRHAVRHIIFILNLSSPKTSVEPPERIRHRQEKQRSDDN